MKTCIILLLVIIPLTLFAPIHKYERKVDNSLAELDRFLHDLGEIESPSYWKNNWQRVNKTTQATGRWQLTPIALKDIGYKGTICQFKNSKEIQKKCVIKLMKRNKQLLGNYSKYIGKTVHGVKITYSGALAACHLSGHGGLKKFIKTGYIATDGNKTVKDYLVKFQNYELNI